jgi:hypothetical protein
MNEDFDTQIYNKLKHENHLIRWLDFWKRKGYTNNSDLKSFKIERLDLALVTFYKGELYAFSGLEDVSNWVDKTYRIKTRCVVTNSCSIRQHGQGLENTSWMPKLHGSIQSLYANRIRPDYNVIMSCNVSVDDKSGTNASVRMAKFLNNPKNFSPYYDNTTTRIATIWHTEQYIYEIDVDYAILLGEKFYGKERFYKFL